jgi:hypothetical protein
VCVSTVEFPGGPLFQWQGWRCRVAALAARGGSSCCDHRLDSRCYKTPVPFREGHCPNGRVGVAALPRWARGGEAVAAIIGLTADATKRRFHLGRAIVPMAGWGRCRVAALPRWQRCRVAALPRCRVGREGEAVAAIIGLTADATKRRFHLGRAIVPMAALRRQRTGYGCHAAAEPLERIYAFNSTSLAMMAFWA